MTFIDTLRSSRNSRVAVLHEFWIQYNPTQNRIHAFFEGHDDVAFFSHFIERSAPPKSRLYVYRCEGKTRVYDAFTQITERSPGVKWVLFFVDKDLDDVLGTALPTDPRIFVTDTYSVENYLVSLDVLLKLYRDAVRLTNVTFDESLLAAQFDRQLRLFHKRIVVLMAWILVSRRFGDRPNLGNLDLARFFEVDDACELRVKTGVRLELISRSTGVPRRALIGRNVLSAARELSRLPPKRVVRGKFEAWFFLLFWKTLLRKLSELSHEAGGKMSVKVSVESNSFCATLKSYIDMPRALELFLGVHFGDSVRSTVASAAPSSVRWRSRLKALFGF